jgi:hypothetical protein
MGFNSGFKGLIILQECLFPSSSQNNRPCGAYLCHISAACLDHGLVTGFITRAISTAENLWPSFLRPGDKSHNLLSHTLLLKAGYFRDNSKNMSERFGIDTKLALSYVLTTRFNIQQFCMMLALH